MPKSPTGLNIISVLYSDVAIESDWDGASTRKTIELGIMKYLRNNNDLLKLRLRRATQMGAMGISATEMQKMNLGRDMHETEIRALNLARELHGTGVGEMQGGDEKGMEKEEMNATDMAALNVGRDMLQKWEG